MPEMLQTKVPTAQTVHREQWRCIRCSLPTQFDNIPVNRGRGKCCAQAQHNGTDPGDVSCDATQVSMIQKLQKTVEFLQIQFIDKVIVVPQAQLIDEAVEVPEIMQRHRQVIQKVKDAQKT